MASITAAEKAVATTRKTLKVAASLTASVMVARSFVNDFVPAQIQDYVYTAISSYFSPRRHQPAAPDFTIVIHNEHGVKEIYEAAEAYVSHLLAPTSLRVRARKRAAEAGIIVTVDATEDVFDNFDGVEFHWHFVPKSSGDGEKVVEKNMMKMMKKEEEEVKKYELRFHRRHKEVALERYLPHVMDRWAAMNAGDRALQLYMFRRPGQWQKQDFVHPSTFDTLAMKPELKSAVMEDLDRFLRRRDYYRRVGKAWKRGYLLYGPPGTGKSSLVAAMANYMKFDVYDLELGEVPDNAALRNILQYTRNTSIVVIEDVDCSVKLPNRAKAKEVVYGGGGVTLSGVLNMLDGVWSSCGVERIVVLTTNHPEQLDPALLRPGRMDMHIHMSYCTAGGFRTLAKNYLGVEEHPGMPEIERMLEEDVNITAAEITGELMRSEDIDEAFGILSAFMVEKKKDPTREKGYIQAPSLRTLSEEDSKEPSELSPPALSRSSSTPANRGEGHRATTYRRPLPYHDAFAP